MDAHLNPAKLVGQRFPRDTFGKARIALVGYCPPPAILNNYAPVAVTDQHFIHVSLDSVKRLSHAGIEFLSLVHIYGGPVSASTIEELAYYEFDFVLAYGLAGGLGTKHLRMGDFYLVESALVADGTTPHYTQEPVVSADAALTTQISELWPKGGRRPMHPVRAITGDAIYREDDAFLEDARARGCDVVNLDSAHLYAVSTINSDGRRMGTVECGVISDVSSSDPGEEWSSTLSAMLSTAGADGLNPLELTGEIVSFYVETLAPLLMNKWS